MISSNPDAEELAKYATWLDQAEAALLKIRLGIKAVSVDYNGEKVTYSAASKSDLLAFIAQLRKALGKAPLANPGVRFKPVSFGRAAPGSGLF